MWHGVQRGSSPRQARKPTLAVYEPLSGTCMMAGPDSGLYEVEDARKRMAGLKRE